jgi:hypothetical protein
LCKLQFKSRRNNYSAAVWSQKAERAQPLSEKLFSSLSSNSLAAFRSEFSKPSVNLSYTGAKTSSASSRRSCISHNRARLVAVRNSQASGLPAGHRETSRQCAIERCRQQFISKHVQCLEGVTQQRDSGFRRTAFTDNSPFTPRPTA